jgi:hypothetical protein
MEWNHNIIGIKALSSIGIKASSFIDAKPRDFKFHFEEPYQETLPIKTD